MRCRRSVGECSAPNEGCGKAPGQGDEDEREDVAKR